MYGVGSLAICKICSNFLLQSIGGSLSLISIAVFIKLLCYS